LTVRMLVFAFSVLIDVVLGVLSGHEEQRRKARARNRRPDDRRRPLLALPVSSARQVVGRAMWAKANHASHLRRNTTAVVPRTAVRYSSSTPSHRARPGALVGQAPATSSGFTSLRRAPEFEYFQPSSATYQRRLEFTLSIQKERDMAKTSGLATLTALFLSLVLHAQQGTTVVDA
jgi:hypothetical protein